MSENSGLLSRKTNLSSPVSFLTSRLSQEEAKSRRKEKHREFLVPTQGDLRIRSRERKGL